MKRDPKHNTLIKNGTESKMKITMAKHRENIMCVAERPLNFYVV